MVNVFTRHEDGYRGKRVVVVGVGNTACDVAVDLSSVCSQVRLRLVIVCLSACVFRRPMSFVALPFQNGLRYHNSDFKILNRMNISTLCTISVTFGPVTPEIVRVTIAPFWTIRKNRHIRPNISATTRPIFVSLSA